MTDILTSWDLQRGDWLIGAPGLAEESGLKSAIILSLFSDRRANPDDALPSPASSDRRGWWGDNFAALQNDRIGSRLWLLSREKQLSKVLLRANEYCKEALQWLIDDGIAKAVEVHAEIVRAGVLGVEIIITRPDGVDQKFQFDDIWSAK